MLKVFSNNIKNLFLENFRKWNMIKTGHSSKWHIAHQEKSDFSLLNHLLWRNQLYQNLALKHLFKKLSKKDQDQLLENKLKVIIIIVLLSKKITFGNLPSRTNHMPFNHTDIFNQMMNVSTSAQMVISNYIDHLLVTFQLNVAQLMLFNFNHKLLKLLSN